MGTLCREGNRKVKRKRYPRKFQRIALEHMRTCESVTELARELGVRLRCLYKWRAKLDLVEPGEESARPRTMISDRLSLPRMPSVCTTSSHQRATQSFLRVPRWKRDPCWKPLPAIVSPLFGISMARPACSAPPCSVVRMSSRLATSTTSAFNKSGNLLSPPS
jgi:transposase-like protein